MNLDVLLFASYADALGAPAVRVTLPADARVADVVAAVRALSALAVLPERPLVAVNHRYARPEQLLQPTDEVALIPPVAGG
jgi:molybdopterin converting factor subunit 1